MRCKEKADFYLRNNPDINRNYFFPIQQTSVSPASGSFVRVTASLSILHHKPTYKNEGRFVLPIAVLAMAGVVAVTGASQLCSVVRNRFALIRH